MLFHKKDSKMSFTMYCHPFKYRHILIIIFTVHKRILKWSWCLVLTYIICSHHDIAEILQKLELNTNQSIHFIWMPSNNLYIIFSMFYGFI